ncbi:hypothetical protein T11_6030 [Trichinella zimbabwensis]|uniref:Uncharacterized protein n=1 Tax=Trichinella zimbabwensis TaxID=268475 RepID=A0A0V1I2N5_9BILA|nr:hypothetical protein T11_6030 [Trichinella zimbabwensis]
MLRFNQLVGFYLIYYFLVCDKAHPIIQDAYLAVDALKFVEAYDIWEKYPEKYREYMGLIADKNTLALMGGYPLRRLSYIAIQIAKKHEPTLRNLKHATPPDYAFLDELIKKYFPDEIGNPRSVCLDEIYGPLLTTSDARIHLMNVASITQSQELYAAIGEISEAKHEKSVIEKIITDSIRRIKANPPESTSGRIVEIIEAPKEDEDIV